MTPLSTPAAQGTVAEPMFPIMGGPKVPWSLIAPYEAQAEKNHYQSLKRLAERGGLSISEAMAVMSSVSFDKCPIAKPTVEDWLDFIAERKARAERRPSPGGVEAGANLAAAVEDYLKHTYHADLDDALDTFRTLTSAPAPEDR